VNIWEISGEYGKYLVHMGNIIWEHMGIYIYLFIFIYIYIFIFVPRVLDFFPGNLDFFPVLSPKQPQTHGLQRKITTIIAFPGACSPRSLLSDPISSSEWQPREQRQGLA
jgi:hypothetical protein